MSKLCNEAGMFILYHAGADEARQRAGDGGKGKSMEEDLEDSGSTRGTDKHDRIRETQQRAELKARLKYRVN